MATGWKSPFPLRMGGGSRDLVGDLYQAARAGTGSLLLGDEGTETDLENRVLARMVACGYRAARRRANGVNPRKLFDGVRPVVMPDGTTQVLSSIDRWERILGIPSSANTSSRKRREAIAHARAPLGANDRGTLRTLIGAILDPWVWSMSHADDVSIEAGTAYWQGADGSAAYPGSPPSGTSTWYSDIFTQFVAFTSPTGTSTTEVARRTARVQVLLEEALPAHADFIVSGV